MFAPSRLAGLLALLAAMGSSASAQTSLLPPTLTLGDGTAYTVGATTSALISRSGDNDSKGSAGGRSFGGYGAVDLTAGENALVINSNNYIRDQGILPGMFVSVMPVAPGDTGKSTVLGGGYPVGTVSGTISTQAVTGSAVGKVALKTGQTLINGATGQTPLTITPAPTSATTTADSFGDTGATVKAYAQSYVQMLSSSGMNYSPTTPTGVAYQGYAYSVAYPEGTTELTLAKAIAAKFDGSAPANPRGPSYTYNTMTLTPTGYGEAVFADTTGVGFNYVGDPPMYFGALPSGNPLGGANERWITIDRTKALPSGDYPYGPLYFAWNKTKNQLDVLCDNTPFYGHADMVGSYPLPPGWQGNLTWMDNMGQYADLSDGWSYAAYQTSTGPFQPAAPLGVITTDQSRVNQKGKVEVLWQLQ